MASSCTAPGWRQCECKTRADHNRKQERSKCRTQSELCGMLVPKSAVRKRLSVSAYAELQGAKDSHRCTDANVIVSATAKSCSYKARRLLAPHGVVRKCTGKNLCISGQLPTEQPAVEQFPHWAVWGWNRLPGPSW